MEDWIRTSRGSDGHEASSGQFKRGDVPQAPSLSMAKQETTVVQLEYMNIKDHDDSSAQTYRRPQHHLRQRSAEHLPFRKHLENFMILEEMENPSRRIAEKKMPVYLLTDVSPLGLRPQGRLYSVALPQSSYYNLMEDLNTNRNQDTMRLRPKARLCRSNSISGSEKRLDCLRMVLIGKTGVGKSSTGNSILGRVAFYSHSSMKSVTKTCQRESGDACGRPVMVVDTPGLFDTSLSNEKVQQEIMRCIELSAPGPHVFLLVIAIGPITQEERETLQLIKMTFGQKAEAYTMVLFTRGDNLDESIEDFITDGDPHVQKLISDCGGRFHVFNNRQKDPDQVVSLLKKIDKMMWSNDASFYNDKMFQEAERAFRLMQINREREEEVRLEMEAIKAKYEAELREVKDKLEEEQAKLKIRELLLMERENMWLKNPRTGRERDTINKDLDTKVSIESENSEEKVPSGPQETAQGATRGEADLDKKKAGKKLGRLESFLKMGRARDKYQKRIMENIDANDTQIQPTYTEVVKEQKIPDEAKAEPKTQTDAENEDMRRLKNSEDEMILNKNKVLHEQYKAMQECRQKMEEIKRRYKEIEEIHAAELKKMKARHDDNFNAWNKKHGNCVLQ